MLKEYEKKRNFEATPEPEADPFEGGEGPLRYVVQMHSATRLHWDFRLELDGVLVSWAVPKGPSMNPADKRYAVHVEDHPLSYASFEGSIPKGQYGGGEVIVWDEGIYTPDEDGKLSWDDREEAQRRMRKELKAGKISITLRGTKLQGSFTLVRMKSDKDWLLIKHKDAHVSETWKIEDHPQSVRSGLTNEDVKAGRTEAKDDKRVRWVEGSQQKKIPKAVLPMAATEIGKPFSDPQWTFEVKLDGIRAMAIVDDGVVKILSRNGKDITEKFPMLVDELGRKAHNSFILDGEIVIYDESGVPSFQGLMQRFQQTNAAMIRKWDLIAPVEFCVFDLVYLDGWDLKEVVLKERRALLEQSQFQGPLVRVIDTFPECGELVYEHAQKLGFEGIVGKKLESKYREGFRSNQWVKVKDYNADEFVIAGYTKGEGARASTFGALLLGKFDGDTLEYVGSVGGGFSDDELVEYRKELDRIKSEVNPFGKKIDAKGKVQFVEPKLWAEVRYMTMTKDGKLRFPSFKRLRPDMSMPSPVKTAAKLGTSANNEVEAVLEQLQGDRDDMKLTVEGHELKLSSLNKIYWPAHGERPPVTKRDLIAYYAKMSEVMIPHLRDRPLSLVRFPEGILGERFFQKHWEHKTPEFVEEVPIWSSHNERSGEYMLCKWDPLESTCRHASLSIL